MVSLMIAQGDEVNNERRGVERGACGIMCFSCCRLLKGPRVGYKVWRLLKGTTREMLGVAGKKLFAAQEHNIGQVNVTVDGKESHLGF